MQIIDEGSNIWFFRIFARNWVGDSPMSPAHSTVVMYSRDTLFWACRIWDSCASGSDDRRFRMCIDVWRMFGWDGSGVWNFRIESCKLLFS